MPRDATFVIVEARTILPDYTLSLLSLTSSALLVIVSLLRREAACSSLHGLVSLVTWPFVDLVRPWPYKASHRSESLGRLRMSRAVSARPPQAGDRHHTCTTPP